MHDLDDRDEIEFDLESLPRITEGTYLFEYDSHSYGYIFEVPKLVVSMRIIEGPCAGVILCRYFNVLKQGKSYRARGTMALRREMVDLFGKAALANGRMPLIKLAGRVVEADVRTVTEDSRGRPLSEVNWYSVIDRLLRVVET